MNALPLTDAAVIKEMNDAYERCIAIGEEIEQLKQEMSELYNVSLIRVTGNCISKLRR